MERTEEQWLIMEARLKELQHEVDSTRGLYCIDRNPKEVEYEWIVENAFRLGGEDA